MVCCLFVLLWFNITFSDTVNVVIFAGGKFREYVGKTFHVGVIFHDTTPISIIKAYGVYFCMGVIFAKKTKARKMRKLPPRENFHVYSISAVQ